MANAAKDQTEAQYLQLAQSDPQMQALVQQLQALRAQSQLGPRGFTNQKALTDTGAAINARFNALLGEHGLTNDNYAIATDPKTGQQSVDHQNWYERNQNWVLPAIVSGGFVGGVGALGGFSGAGGAAGASGASGGSTGGAAGGTAAAATSPYEIGGGAAGGIGSGTTAATAIPSGAAALPASAAPVLSGADTTAAATGWRSWLPKVQSLLPVVGDVVRGVTANSALNNAQKATQAATDAAMARNDKAQQQIGDVYQQQRQDTQNLANVPYQKRVGSLMGINIPNIGPAQGQVPTMASPMGYKVGLVPASQAPPLGVQQGNFTIPNGAPQPASAATLAQLAALAPATAKAKSTSSYKRA